MLKKEKNNNLNTRISIIVGVISILFGIILLSSNYINSKVLKAYNNMNLQILALDNIELEEKEEETITKEETSTKETTNKTKVEYKYISKLIIEKINLKQGLVSYNSKYNNVEYNIQTLKGSSYPTKENSNLILASHSGSSSISYFKNLYKLQVNDEIKLEYKDKTYIYKINNIYTKPKTGNIAIYRDYDKTTLTLITCTRNNNKKQTVYIAYLESIE